MTVERSSMFIFVAAKGAKGNTLDLACPRLVNSSVAYDASLCGGSEI